jgi:hypothetical protein
MSHHSNWSWTESGNREEGPGLKKTGSANWQADYKTLKIVSKILSLMMEDPDETGR